MQAGIVAGLCVLGGLVAHTLVDAHDLRLDRQTLLAKQRAVQATLGTEWEPLRARLEGDVLTSAKDYPGDQVDPDAKKGEFKTQPGLYLRMRVADARDAASVRRIAADAQKDGFSSCLLREPNERGIRGELDGGAFSEQPWNLGRAYSATWTLTDEWAQLVKDADDDLRMRVLKQQYEKAVAEQIPLAIEIVKRAQFLLLVLDEDSPLADSSVDAGRTAEEALQLVAHPTRVFLFHLPDNKVTLRLRRSAEARVIPAGERLITDPEIRDATQRQANNCALARAVEAALH
ncbi:MAG: hypothetical protein ACRENE_06255 [Polyangiaceae bacterium]